MPLSVNSRSKVSGWSRYKFSEEFIYLGGKKHIQPNQKSIFFNSYIRNIISRKGCFYCKFKGYERNSDITLGDFLGVWSIMPDMDDDKGTSIVMIHTLAGQRAIKDILDRIVIKPVSLEEVSKENRAVVHSHKMEKSIKSIVMSLLIKAYIFIKVIKHS